MVQFKVIEVSLTLISGNFLKDFLDLYSIANNMPNNHQKSTFQDSQDTFSTVFLMPFPSTRRSQGPLGTSKYTDRTPLLIHSPVAMKKQDPMFGGEARADD